MPRVWKRAKVQNQAMSVMSVTGFPLPTQAHPTSDSVAKKRGSQCTSKFVSK